MIFLCSFENYKTTVTIDGQSIDLSLSDTAGQEEYGSVRQYAYENIDAFILCFAVDVPNSLASIKSIWLQELQHMIQNDLRIILVATKADLRSNQESISKLGKSGLTHVGFKEGANAAKEIGALEYVETSALTGYCVSNVFEAAIRAVTCPELLTYGKMETEMPEDVDTPSKKKSFLCCF